MLGFCSIAAGYTIVLTGLIGFFLMVIAYITPVLIKSSKEILSERLLFLIEVLGGNIAVIIRRKGRCLEV